MKTKIIVILFLTFLVLGSCGTQSKKDFVSFPHSNEIFFDDVSIPNILAAPMDLIINNQKIIVYDAKSDWIFQVFSLSDRDFLGSVIRRGRGPHEEVEVAPYLRRVNKDSFLYQSSNSVKIANVRYNEDEIELFILRDYSLPPEMMDDTDFFLIDNQIFSSVTFRPSVKDFRYFNKQTNIVSGWGERFPFNSPNDLDLDPDRSIYVAKYTSVNANENRLAVVYQNLPFLRIYCTETSEILNQHQVADGGKNEEFLLNNLWEAGFITFYSRIKSTEDFIFTLYTGTDLYFEDGIITDFASEIHVWDWDGNPIMKLELDRPVFSFDVTPDNKQIIAVSLADVDNLFMADIPWD